VIVEVEAVPSAAADVELQSSLLKPRTAMRYCSPVFAVWLVNWMLRLIA
jgi:hypothetical protein